MSQDYYELLGVNRTAGAEDIKKAFRKLAMQHHPDRNPGDKGSEKKFKDLTHAYDILKDPEKRAAYDRYGPAAFEGGAGPADRAAFHGPGLRFRLGVRRHLRGDVRRRRRAAVGAADAATRAARICASISRSRLEQAYGGTEATVRVPSSVACEVCHGSGAEAGSKPQQCRPATAAAGCAPSRASSPSSAPATPATARAR
jgi:DnaJ-class molecular chaperone with C-terminal Zn finger domain